MEILNLNLRPIQTAFQKSNLKQKEKFSSKSQKAAGSRFLSRVLTLVDFC
jgi:hypothetical protein